MDLTLCTYRLICDYSLINRQDVLLLVGIGFVVGVPWDGVGWPSYARTAGLFCVTRTSSQDYGVRPETIGCWGSRSM